VSALLSLLQEKIITESKNSSLIFPSFLLDVLFSKWFNIVNKLTTNGGQLCAARATHGVRAAVN